MSFMDKHALLVFDHFTLSRSLAKVQFTQSHYMTFDTVEKLALT